MNYNNNYASTKTYNNQIIRTLHSPGYSAMVMSLYKKNVVLGLAPYINPNQEFPGPYDRKQFLSTSIDYEAAAAFCLLAKPILNDSEQPIEFILPCAHQATLILKYERDEQNDMRTYLILEKNGKTLAFRFDTRKYLVKINGSTVARFMQTGFEAFVRALEGYLEARGTNKYEDEKPKYELTAEDLMRMDGTLN